MPAPGQSCSHGKSPMSFGPALNHCCRGAILAPSGDASSDAGPEADASPFRRAPFLPRLSMGCAPVANGRPCPKASAAPAPSIITSSNSGGRDFSGGCGGRGWLRMTKWRESLGNGKAWTAPKAKPLWRKRRWKTTPRIGKKKGTKRSLLVDARGAPLSLIVAGANRHDVTLLAQTLDAIVVRRRGLRARLSVRGT
jgi:hypothetical protein